MLAQDPESPAGRIVNIASAVVWLGPPGMVATETAVATGVTRDLERVVAGQSVPRPQQPEDLVSTLLYLCDPRSSFVTGAAINFDGGHAKH